MNKLKENMLRFGTKNLSEQVNNEDPGKIAYDLKQQSKTDLITMLENHLSKLKTDLNADGTMVAKIMYNDCAHYLNKTDLFTDQSKHGQPLQRKAQFAPER